MKLALVVLATIMYFWVSPLPLKVEGYIIGTEVFIGIVLYLEGRNV